MQQSNFPAMTFENYALIERWCWLQLGEFDFSLGATQPASLDLLWQFLLPNRKLTYVWFCLHLNPFTPLSICCRAFHATNANINVLSNAFQNEFMAFLSSCRWNVERVGVTLRVCLLSLAALAFVYFQC